MTPSQRTSIAVPPIDSLLPSSVPVLGIPHLIAPLHRRSQDLMAPFPLLQILGLGESRPNRSPLWCRVHRDHQPQHDACIRVHGGLADFVPVSEHLLLLCFCTRIVLVHCALCSGRLTVILTSRRADAGVYPVASPWRLSTWYWSSLPLSRRHADRAPHQKS